MDYKTNGLSMSMQCGWERKVHRPAPALFGRSTRLLASSPVRKTFFSTIQTDLSRTPFLHSAYWTPFEKKYAR